MAYWNAVTVF